jgi:hypothetical protein
MVAASQSGDESFVGLQQNAGGVVHVVRHNVQYDGHAVSMRLFNEEA